MKLNLLSFERVLLLFTAWPR